VALLAVARAVEVGVDVELLRPLPDALRIARSFFSPAEVDRLAALRPDEREAGFLACWTRKEAFVKARGDGLTLALDAFDVGYAGAPCAVLRTGWAPAEAADWRMIDLSRPDAGYVAAATARADLAVRCFDLDPLNLVEPQPILKETT
jgi:4'-phosphopantetheinyl transferase